MTCYGVTFTFTYLLLLFEILGVGILNNQKIYLNTFGGGGVHTVFTLHYWHVFVIYFEVKGGIWSLVTFILCIWSLPCIIVA